MPTGEWTKLDETTGLWTAEYRVPGMKSRSSAVRLRDGSFVVYSPGVGLAESFADQAGDVSFLFAPNSYHYLGLEEWRRRFPDAQVTAGLVAHARLRKQGVSDAQPLSDLGLALPPAVELLEVPGTRIGEVWLDVPATDCHTWLIGDSFFNMKEPRSRRARALQRVNKSGPGLAMSRLMKWGGLTNRGIYQKWVEGQLVARKPKRILPLHGDPLEGDGIAERVRAFAVERIGSGD